MYFIFRTSVVAILLSLNLSTFAQNNSLRIEPPHWWVGMSNPELELMIYAPDVAEANVNILEGNAELKSVSRETSDDYLFVTLNLASATTAQNLIMELTNGKSTTRFTYTLKAREADSEARQGFNTSDVVYLITPDRFANGDSKNDKVAGMKDSMGSEDDYGRFGGDIRGIINHIPYLDSIGFTALWSSPLLENDMPKASYHGYAITDLYAIDPRFGSMEDYLELSRELESRNIKLIMDVVPNHIGSEHWWMKNLPSNAWISHEGTYKQTTHNRSTIHDPNASAKDKDDFVSGWFVKTMPDLNQRNTHLSTYLIQNSIWWIEQAGLDGLRIDTYPYSHEGFLADYCCAIMAEYPNLNLVGEEWTTNPAYIAYWQKGSSRNSETCLPSLFDFPMQAALAQALTEEESWNSGWTKLHECMAQDFHYADPNNLMVFGDNHDMDRFFRQVNHDLDLYKLGMTILLTTRGIPQVYYGTEVLLANTKAGDHGDIRMPFPGGWPADERNPQTGAGLSDEQKEALAFTRDLLHYRKGSKAIAEGEFLHFKPEDGVYVFARKLDGLMVMVLLNKSDKEVKLDLSRYEEALGGMTAAKSVLSGTEVNLKSALKIKARTPMILECK